MAAADTLHGTEWDPHEWKRYGTLTNAYGEKRQRYRCSGCGKTEVDRRCTRRGPRPLTELPPFRRFWEEVELQFTRVGLAGAIAMGCAAAAVSRRTVSKWLKARQHPPAPSGIWAPPPRRRLLLACLEVGKLGPRSRAYRAYDVEGYETVRDDVRGVGAASLQADSFAAWTALLIARSAVSIVQGRPLPPWMFIAPEAAEPWLSLMRDFTPRSSRSGPVGPPGESGLRYLLGVDSVQAAVLIGTRRKPLVVVHERFPISNYFVLRSYLPLLPARARVQGDTLQIPVWGFRHKRAQPFFEVALT